MTRPKDAGERLRALADALAESVADAPDGELLEDARLEGRDAKKTQEDVQRLLRAGVLAFKKQRMVEAERQHEQAANSIRARKFEMPKDSLARRLLLGRVLQREPQLQSTLQFRDFDKLTDEDVESMLQKLSHLGVLDEE